jgi:hypothetical protein
MNVVENQLRDNDPPESRKTFERLLEEGFSELDAKKLIAKVIASETFWIIKKSDAFNHKRFVNNLSRLPEDPEEGSI